MSFNSRNPETKQVKEKPLFALLGPTAIGKSYIASIIAEPLDAEIISVDSMQVYKGMDIGTSKPGTEERSRNPYHLIDLVEPQTAFSAAEFKKAAQDAIEVIGAKGRRALLVGGSGLYFRAVVDDLDFSDHMTSKEKRLEIEEEFRDTSNYELHLLLADLDPEAAEAIHEGNRRRVLRAIEVARSGGRLISDRQDSWNGFHSFYKLKAAGLEMDRPLLYRLIEARVDKMMEHGFLKEVELLAASGKLIGGTTAGEAIGYKQILEHLDGVMSLEESVDLIKKKTRHYAKRQITWFKKDPRIKWFKIKGKANCSLEELEDYERNTASEVLEYMLS